MHAARKFLESRKIDLTRFIRDINYYEEERRKEEADVSALSLWDSSGKLTSFLRWSVYEFETSLVSRTWRYSGSWVNSRYYSAWADRWFFDFKRDVATPTHTQAKKKEYFASLILQRYSIGLSESLHFFEFSRRTALHILGQNTRTSWSRQHRPCSYFEEINSC